MKLAIGPAATTAARLRHRLMEEAGGARSRSCWPRRLVGHARGIVVAEKLHIAAERDGRKLPAGAMAIVEADDFGTETHRKSEHPHAAPARDEEMAELVEEDDNGQAEQKRNDLAGDPAPQSSEATNVISAPVPTRSPTRDYA